MREHTVQNLMELFLRTNDLKRLVNEAALVLKNPLVVCDTSYHFLAHSSPTGIEDKSWRRGLHQDGWSYELVSMISRLDLDYTGQEPKSGILTNINAYSTARRRISTLCIEGAHLGYVLLLEAHTPLEAIEEETYRQVEVILTKCLCLERPMQLSNKSNSPESILLDLMQSDFASEQLFQERIAQSSLAGNGSFRVFCIDTSTYDRNAQRASGKTDSDIRTMVGHCLPLSWQVCIRDRIVVLADFSTDADQNRAMLERFCQYLEETRLCCGYSDMFFNAYKLRQYYEQACAALQLGRSLQDQRRLIPYEDYRIFDLFRHLDGENCFSRYATRPIQAVCRYDEANGTAYMETVRHYLGNGCSVRKTAQALYIHRNTVVYRIARLEELFGLTFEDGYQNHLHYISCLLYQFCKCCKQRKNEAPTQKTF